jgi:hypothetical protein
MSTSSIFYQAGELVKQKIATEISQINTGAVGFTKSIGDNIHSTINVQHNLDSNNIIFSIREAATNEFIYTDTKIVDKDNIRFDFDTVPTIGQYYVTVLSTDGSAGGGGNTCASSPVEITVSSGSSGGGQYTTSGANGKGGLFGCINVYRGQTLTIDVVGDSSDILAHPLQITNHNSLGQAMGSVDGVIKTTYGSEQDGAAYTLTWTVPCDETVTKYQYQSSESAGVQGIINVLGSCDPATSGTTYPTIAGALSLDDTTPTWKGTSGITASREAEGKFRLTFPTAYSAVSDYHVVASFQDYSSPTQDITVGVERATTHVDLHTLRSSGGENVEQGDITVLIYEFN